MVFADSTETINAKMDLTMQVLIKHDEQIKHLLDDWRIFNMMFIQIVIT